MVSRSGRRPMMVGLTLPLISAVSVSLSHYGCAASASLKEALSGISQMTREVSKINDVSDEVGSSGVSYVIEPFEYFGSGWFERLRGGGVLNLTLTSKEGMFGSRALRVEYSASEETSRGSEDGPGNVFATFGDILDGRSVHNCQGATHAAMRYKVFQTVGSLRAQLRLVLLDVHSKCRYGPWLGCSESSSSHDYDRVLGEDKPAGINSGDEWQELRLDLRVDNTSLDVGRLRGWRLEISIHDVDGTLASSAGLPVDGLSNTTRFTTGVLLIDQLSCVGRGDMLGAAFRFPGSFADAVEDNAWFERYYQSPLSSKQSHVSLSNGVLAVNYTVEQTNTWGGFADFQHLAPGAAYYNLSLADSFSFHYEVLVPSSIPGRAHLRVILLDGSDCDLTNECASYPGHNLENYYAFKYILDADENCPKAGEISIPLEGSGESSTPFWRAGWSGTVGNDMLNKDLIKGFRFEINVDSQGDVGSLVNGFVALSNLEAFSSSDNEIMTSASSNDETKSGPELKCIREPDLMFNEASSVFRKIEFLGSKCCRACEDDPNCLYAHSNGMDCFLASHLEVDSVGLLSTEHTQKTFAAFWTDDAAKRGDFCSRCDCRERDRTIDCRGRDLAIVPRTFSPWLGSGDTLTTVISWTPRVLDLRNNTRLVLLGSCALAEVADSLEELWLPTNMRHISLDSLSELSALLHVHFEVDEKMGGSMPFSSLPSRESHQGLNNVIITPSDFFLNVCCGRGQQLDFLSPREGLTFCDLKVNTPGADAVYEPFLQYIDASPLMVVRPSSTFMAEAAESAGKCAAYCAITDGCKYFSYDGRWAQSEPTCYLFENNGTRWESVCCSPHDFADVEDSAPGWTSGRPPQTRHDVEGASVWSAPHTLVVDPTNGYQTQFSLSLGQKPLRGAVWIVPTLTTPATELEVLITPQRVVLYDATSVVTVNVSVSGVNALATGKTLVVTNIVMSCDTAFTATTLPVTAGGSTVYINVAVIPKWRLSHAGKIALCVAAGVVSLFALAWIFRKFRRSLAKKAALEAERAVIVKEQVIAAQERVKEFQAHLALCLGSVFVRLGALRQHEELRDSNKLVYIDSVNKLADLKKRCNAVIVFFSHQWLSFDEADPEGVQYAAMVRATFDVARVAGVGVQDVYIWVDVLSIPQSNHSVQKLAIASLPAFSSAADFFIIVAPRAMHRDTDTICDKASYHKRSWCRAEVMSYWAVNGTDYMFYAISSDLDLSIDPSNSRSGTSPSAVDEVSCDGTAPTAVCGESTNESDTEGPSVKILINEDLPGDSCCEIKSQSLLPLDNFLTTDKAASGTAESNDVFLDAIDVFGGDLTCCRLGHHDGVPCDKEALMLPMLGLFAELYRGRKCRTEAAYKRIEHLVDRLYPRTFRWQYINNKGDHCATTLPLFGDLIDAVKFAVHVSEKEDAMTRQPPDFMPGTNAARHREKVTHSISPHETRIPWTRTDCERRKLNRLSSSKSSLSSKTSLKECVINSAREGLSVVAASKR